MDWVVLICREDIMELDDGPLKDVGILRLIECMIDDDELID